jgi:hypothetical protein
MQLCIKYEPLPSSSYPNLSKICLKYPKLLVQFHHAWFERCDIGLLDFSSWLNLFFFLQIHWRWNIFLDLRKLTFWKAYFIGPGEKVKLRLSQTLIKGARSYSNSRPAVQISNPLPSRYASWGQAPIYSLNPNFPIFKIVFSVKFVLWTVHKFCIRTHPSEMTKKLLLSLLRKNKNWCCIALRLFAKTTALSYC